MILLSRLIKGTGWAPPVQSEKKIISIKVFDPLNQREEPEFTSIDTEKLIQTMLHEAEMQAESIVSHAQHEAENLRKQIEDERIAFEIEKAEIAELARNTGFTQGLEEGRRQGYHEFHEIIQSAKDVVESAKRDYRMHVDSSEKTILELGLKVAGKILGKTLKDKEEEFLSVVKRALKEARDNKEVQLHVHPVQYDFLLANKEEIMALFPKDIDFYIYPNDDLSETSCLIESENGRIDASIDSQLEEIKQKLIELLEGE
ncbi:flagellar assembly protein FliH [Cytobacillus solani]|uniref:Flagellar assembly protein FliH n=1 Tax=Cytobacillus solani TaxID=1637975 RepID=A0A0Q3VHH6_9BACI|nr:flagellar assembly protein FliH [Cytobacillus solani]KQL19114.1 flagellar assembly protein FliH [Cytobacillus solani]